MKRIVFCFVLALVAMSFAIAQNKPNFSGEWELDVQKSQLDARSRIEGMTLKVTQTEKEIKVETQVKRKPLTEARSDTGGRMGAGGMGMMGDGTYTYTLDGKESQITQETPFGSVPVSLKAKFEEKGVLKLSQTRTIDAPMGTFSVTVKETWKLSEDGKTLTIKREIESPRGVNSSELVFVKQK